VRLALVLLALGPAGAAAGPTQASSDRDVGAYLQLVELYRRGERDAAARALLRWRNEDIRECAVRLTPAAGCPARCVAASILLHTELSVALRRAGRAGEAGFHVELAERVAGDLAGPELSPFVRKWRLGVGWHLLDWGRLDEAQAWLGRALKASPKDPEILLVLSAVYTAAARGIAPSGALARASRYSGLSLLEARDEAFDSLKTVLAADPAHEEAYFRRALLNRYVGEMGPARRDFEWLLERSGDPWKRYLSHLMLGAMDEDARRHADAIAHYRAAVDLEPSSPTARLALSHALLAREDVAEALSAVRAAFAPGDGATAAADGWARLRVEGDVRYRTLVDALRAGVAP
jgi:tetratricopeptide (TPR) repeat protein